MILADYTKEMEGELTVSAGDVVQLISRDATGISNTILLPFLFEYCTSQKKNIYNF